jgi:hypothetical protein
VTVAPALPAASEAVDLPALPLPPWEPTRATLHLYVQIVGKIRLASTPHRNHWWNVPLYVTARGLTTGRMSLGGVDYEIAFDFLDHELRAQTAGGETFVLPLRDGLPVAEFHGRLLGGLEALGITPRILARPFGTRYSDIPFADDTHHAAYDRDAVTRYWRSLRWVAGVLDEFAGRFRGKQSPVHMFWHSFDLAVTRFSGRPAPPMPDADPVTREAYSEEVVSFGFWPGDQDVREATLYAYAAPEPPGLARHDLEPAAAHWIPNGGSHTAHLSFEAVRTDDDPRSAALAFLESVFRAASEAGDWPQPASRRPIAD